MHCVTLADLAATISQHAQAIIYRRGEIPAVAMVQYWASSRNRFDLWHKAMGRYSESERSGDSVAMRIWWQQHRVILEEVLVSEMLTRVVAALGAALDQASDTEEVAPITHAIHLSQLEASNRAQNLMLRGRGSSVQDSVCLNRLRTGVERWTDALVGRISADSHGHIAYGFDQIRARTHAEELREYGDDRSRETASWLMDAAMRDMLSRRTSRRAALPQANQEVAASVLMMLSDELFDDLGMFKSRRLHRMMKDHETSDTTPQVEAELTDVEALEIEDYLQDDIHRWYMK